MLKLCLCLLCCELIEGFQSNFVFTLVLTESYKESLHFLGGVNKNKPNGGVWYNTCSAFIHYIFSPFFGIVDNILFTIHNKMLRVGAKP